LPISLPVCLLNWKRVIGKALRKDPNQRWQSMRQVYEVLSGLRQRYESGFLSQTFILPPVKKKSRVLPMVAVAAIVAIGIGGWWVASRQTPPPAPTPPQQQAQVIASPPPPGSERPSPLQPAEKPVEILTNAGVLAMVAAKLPEAVVVDHIRAAGSKAKFELSTDEVIRLSRLGVTPAMLEAMRDPNGTPAVRTTPVSPAVETKQVAVLSGLPIAVVLATSVPNDPEPGYAVEVHSQRRFRGE
jgi:cytoskeletal protein RodZ